jgi:hypothetical protein
MVIDVDGIRVHVPARYPSYPPRYKDEITKMVGDLRHRCGDRLHSVHVTRVVKTRTHLRIDGDWVLKAPGEP